MEDGEDQEPKAGEGDAGKKKKPRKKQKKKSGKDSDEADSGDGGAQTAPPPYTVLQPPDVPKLQSIDEGSIYAGPPEEWTDITDLCNLAVSGMELGEMVESPQFRLFDAMSAIEIMDPKMDSGYKNDEDMSLEKAVSAGIISQKLTHGELVVIWDQLLMYYLMWLEGHTIVQTCFCCLYLQDVKKYLKPMPLFGAFADAFLAACRAARGAVLRAGVFDDEDFMPNMFGVDFEACVYSSDVKEVRARIDSELKALRAPSPAPDADAVAARLEFVCSYMEALESLVGEEGVAQQPAQQKRLGKCLELVERLDKTAREPGPGGLACFDPSINRKLLVPGPPRTVEPIQDPHKAFGMWTSHLQELQLCATLSQRPLAQILEGAVTVKEEPNILPRSVAQLCVSEEGLARRLMLDSLALHLFPREAVQHCKKAVDSFLAHSESLFSHLLKLAHANSARRFRRLAHVFPDFNALQHKAWHLDEELKTTFGANLRHPRPCWVWIMEHCLQAMIAKLLLGFELDLYDQVEVHMIYWYVDYLYGLRLFNLNELYHAKEQTAGGAKKKPAARQQKAAQDPRAGGLRPRAPPPFLLLLEATRSAVRGLFRLLAFCLCRGLLDVPRAAQEGLAQRFVLRFRCLEHFRLPHLPSYNDFEQSSASAQGQAPMEGRFVLDAAQASFTEASQLLEKATSQKDRPAGEDGDAHGAPPEECKALRRVLVANQLAVTRLSRAIEAGQILKKTMQVVAANPHHPHLVSVQVSAVES